MSRILLSTDELTGISQYHEYDSLTDTSRFISVGDAEPVLDINKKIANEEDFTRKGIKDGWWFYASIPPIVQLKLLTEKGINVWKKEDGPRLSKVLEDPEYRYLKTTHKRHVIK